LMVPKDAIKQLPPTMWFTWFSKFDVIAASLQSYVTN
jgi:hypothetical protein